MERLTATLKEHIKATTASAGGGCGRPAPILIAPLLSTMTALSITSATMSTAIVRETVTKETVVVQQQGNLNTTPLLKRAFMFLEDGDWLNANEYCEKVLDLDPENAEAYLGKLMAELHISTREGLKDQPEPFDTLGNYRKAMRFGDDKLKSELSRTIDQINTRIENRITISQTVKKI